MHCEGPWSQAYDTHMTPNSSNKKHQVAIPVAAGAQLSAGSVQEHPGIWGTALLHCCFPLGQLVLSAEDGCAANNIKSEICVLIYGYLLFQGLECKLCI